MTRNIAPRGLSAAIAYPATKKINSPSASGHAGLQRQHVKHTAHLAAQRLIDDLVLLAAGLATEGFRDHGRGIMVAVTGEVPDRHLGIGDRCLDHRLDIVGVHWHSALAPSTAFEFRPWNHLPGSPGPAGPNLA